MPNAKRQAPPVRFRTVLLMALGIWLGASELLRGQTEWQTGKQFWRQLELPADIHWVDNPLRSAVENYARSQRVFIWLDRRIDPDRRVTFDAEGGSLELTLRRLAVDLGGGVGLLDSVVYLGPAHAAPRLATTVALRIEEARKLPAERQGRLLGRRGMQWADLAAPRELLQAIADEGQVTIENPEVVPHDLWAAADLPPLTIPERLSLVLVGFDLSFEWDSTGRQIRLVPFPQAPVLVRSYTHRGALDVAARELSALFPQARIERVGPRLSVSGSYEVHVQIERWLKGEKVTREGERRYTVTIAQQPVGPVIQGLTQRLGLRLDIDARLSGQLEQLVSFRVENATSDELLQAAVRGTGLRLTRIGDLVTLAPE